MAELKQSPLGSVTGSVGDITFRRKNGKVFICRKTRSFVPGRDPESINRRMRFALAGRLARAVYSVPELKSLWKEMTPDEKSPFNMIVKSNIGFINPDSISDMTTITPRQAKQERGADGSLDVRCDAWSLDGWTMTVDVFASDKHTAVGADGELYVKLAYIMCLTQPLSPSFPAVSFITGTTGPKRIAVETAERFEAALSAELAERYTNYSSARLLFTLLLLDADNNPISYSSTVVK